MTPERARGRTAVALGVLCLTLYVSSLRAPEALDALPARLVPFSLLREGNTDLDEFRWLTPKPGELGYFLRPGANGHLVSRYPLATAFLAVPAAPVAPSDGGSKST